MIPLKGLRILAVEQYGAGPFATLQMADLGAEVIKIENPAVGGDVSRYIPPYRLEEDSLFYQAFNRNKKSVGLNLKTPQGQELFQQLVTRSDVVYSNLRGDQPARLGVDYDHLKAVNPQIVCCNLSGFGMSGPRADEPGYDYLIQGLAGFMSLTGEPEAPPAKSGVSVIDFSTGFVSVIGVLAGLRQSSETGEGCQVDVSLLDTAISMLNYLAIWHLNRGYEPERLSHSAHPTVVPSQVFEAGDGYVVVMCQKEKFWQALCRVLEREDLLEDPRFGSADGRLEHREALIAILEPVFKRQPVAYWVNTLRGKVPCAPVNEVEEAFRDPQVLARHLVIEVSHPEYGTLKETGSPIQIMGEKGKGSPDRSRRAPSLGEHTMEILTTLCGVQPEMVERWRDQEIVR